MKKKQMNLKHFSQHSRQSIKMLLSLFCLLGITSIFPPLAKAYSQHQKINISVSNVSIEELIKTVKTQAAVDFLYNIKEIESKGNVSVEMSEATVSEILKEAFKGKKLDFSVENDVIVIRPIHRTTENQDSKTVKGTVVDDNGEKLPGVSVMIKGTSIGVITDTKGVFQLNLPTEQIKKLTLIFSFVGMKTREVVYKNEAILNVTLQENIADLDEVVVTGYQVLDKRTQTSAITSVKASDILVPGMMSIDAALEGQIPELMVMTNSGEVGATPRLRLRGTTTLLGNREPLWVVDGFPVSDPVSVDPEALNDPDYLNIIGNAIGGLNPQDIERIDVLKDASATALYGVKASNGVIVVTTKKGERGKPRISYSHASKFSRRPRYTDRAINLMNSQERVQFGKELCDIHYVFPDNMIKVGYEGAYWRLQTGQTNYEQFANEVRQYEETNTDWFDVLTRDSYSQDHNLSVSGGSDNLTCYASFGYGKDNGVSKTTFNERYTVMVNLDAKFSPKVSLSVGVGGNMLKKNNLNADIDAMDYAYNTTRALPCYNPDGSLFYYQNIGYKNGLTSKQYNTYRYNIWNEINNSSNGYNGNSLNANLNLKIKPYKGGEIIAQGSYSRSSTTQEQWWGERSHYVARLKDGEYEDAPAKGKVDDDGKILGGLCELPYGGILKTQNTINTNYTFRIQANLRQVLGAEKNHFLNEMIIYEVRGTEYLGYSDENRGYMKERGLKFSEFTLTQLMDFPYYATFLGKSNRKISNGLTHNLSGTFSASYSYKSMLTLNSNIRMEASNKFGDRSRDRFLPIWSASFMFNLKQTFFKESKNLSSWSIRSSYGVQGNMLESESPNLVVQKKPIDPYFNQSISTVARYPNPNLKWEKTQNVNVTMDVSLFESRLNFNTNFYYRKTTDNFSKVAVSTVNGLSEFQMNSGDAVNKGYSFSVNVTPIKTKDFSLRFTTSYSGNLNKIVTPTADSYSFSDYLSGKAIVSGESIGTFYSYKFMGLSPEDGVPLFEDYADRRYLLEYKTLEETVKMTMINSGTREPKFSGNFNTYISYKRLSFSMSLIYSLGSKVRLFPLYAPVIDGIKANNNVRKEFTDRWMAPGDEKYTNVPVILSPANPLSDKYRRHYSAEAYSHTRIFQFANSIWNMYDNSDLRVISGNYLKCSSLRLSYSIPYEILRNTPITGASISLNAMNMFTISAKALKGQDPSQAGFAKPNLSVRPTYSVGLNVSF